MSKGSKKILLNAKVVLYDRVQYGGIEVEDGRISRIF
jgi:alpha-D-ribose 1-methylphosphonate 5-triphosphate diphosphatase PhnM